jgi:serine/threonine-protein kinase
VDLNEPEQVEGPAEKTAHSETEILAVGTLVADKYRILALLGTGGMGVVYKARHQLMNKNVALKMLHKHLVRSSQSLMRFQQEARTANTLSHQNIVKVFDFGITPDAQAYQVIECLEGKSLAEVIDENGPLPVERAMHIFIQACDALQHAHTNGVIHRDLKPSNIMLAANENDYDIVKIVDFGIAKMLPQEGGDVLKLTQTGEVFGSPVYMSPEQCLGTELDGRSDIYSMGCLIYESLTGSPPLVGGNLYDTIYKQINELPPGLAQTKPDLPKLGQLEQIVFKCLAKSADQRYQTMAQLKDDLELVARGLRKSWLSQLTANFDLLKIRSAPLRKRLPIRLLSVLSAIILVLSLLSGWMTYSLFGSSKLPAYHEVPWPIYPTEHSQPPEDFAIEEIKRSKLLDHARRTAANNRSILARCLKSSAYFYYKYGHYTQASTYFDQLVKVSRSNSHSQPLIESLDLEARADWAELYTKMAHCSYMLGRYKDAAKLYQNAIDNYIMYPSPPPQMMFDAYARMADCFFLDNDANGAWKSYQWIERRFNEGRFPEGMIAPETLALFYSKRGDFFRHRLDWSPALADYNRAGKYWSRLQVNHDLQTGIIDYYRALSLKAKGLTAEATEQCRSAVDLLKGPLGKDSRDYAGILQTYSELLYQRGDLLQAFQVGMTAKSIAASKQASIEQQSK